MFAWSGAMPRAHIAPYVAAQIAGGICGTVIAHLMFNLDIVDFTSKARAGGALLFAEVVATFGLLVTILAGVRFNRAGVPWLVGLYITAAYWFTASTSFANPAVTIARALTPTFSGIRPLDAPGFIFAQLAGAFCAAFLCKWLLRPEAIDQEKNAQP